jgi:hypothetical protein
VGRNKIEMSRRRFTFVKGVARAAEKILANEVRDGLAMVSTCNERLKRPVACGATPNISEIDTRISERKSSHVLTDQMYR